MIDLLLKWLHAMLIEAIKAQLQRLNRDITSQDALEFFENYSPEDRVYVTHITPEAKFMDGLTEVADFDDFEHRQNMGLDDLQALANLYEQLKAIDDDQDSIRAIGRAVLQQARLEGRDVVDVQLEPVTEKIHNLSTNEPEEMKTFHIYMGTGDGRTFQIFAHEIVE